MDEGKPAGTVAAAKNRKTLWRIIAAVIVFWAMAAAILRPTYLRNIGKAWLQNKCQDRGGCWNAGEGHCELDDKSKCN